MRRKNFRFFDTKAAKLFNVSDADYKKALKFGIITMINLTPASTEKKI